MSEKRWPGSFSSSVKRLAPRTKRSNSKCSLNVLTLKRSAMPVCENSKLDHEKQQRDHDGEQRREADAQRERCEEERRAAAEKPSTHDITDTLRGENLTLRELFDRLTDSWREETERQHKESKQSGKDVSGFGESRSNCAATKARRTVSKM
ncbi:hypothetical protein H4582DRAFT_2187072 [Lactarius indigo]|nr:hypothetical protein H4582DRAFT_2187072 [Lactarius indigo]